MTRKCSRNIFIIGYGAKNRSVDNQESTGKDVMAEYLRDKIGLTFQSSSYFACERFLYPIFKDKYGYESIQECYQDRHSEGMREAWYNAISDLNRVDATTISTAMFEELSVYVGLRSEVELKAAQQKWPDCLTIWVDASDRIVPEESTSCTVTADMADIIIKNNGTLEQFYKKIDKILPIFGV